MTPLSGHDAQVQAAWTAHRPYLLAVAAGMLKRRDDAEDVVQDAFARLTASPDAIEDVRGWLVVVTRRLCLDRLDKAVCAAVSRPVWQQRGRPSRVVSLPVRRAGGQGVLCLRRRPQRLVQAGRGMASHRWRWPASRG